MAKLHQVFILIRKEMRADFRQSTAFAGVLLYAAILVVMIFLSFKQVSDGLWNALFNLLMVFSGLQIGAKGFQTETQAQQRFWKVLVPAPTIWYAKWAYTLGNMVLCSIFVFILFAILLGLPSQLGVLWMCVMCMSTFTLGSIFALMSAIAQVAGGGLALTAILAIPLSLPACVLIQKVSASAILGVPFAMVQQDFLLLIALALGIAVLGRILFPFVWKE